MVRSQQLQVLSSTLHVSHSQISTFLACSLKYRFRYVERRPPERRAIALPFGIAVHSAVEHHYRAMMEAGSPAPIEHLKELFSDALSREIARSDTRIAFNSTLPGLEAARTMGFSMIEAFAAEVAAAVPERIVDVELPLSAPLYDHEGCDTGFNLIGIVDLLVVDAGGRLTVVDLKTAARTKRKEDVDADLQLSAYACLLSSEGYLPPDEPLHCRLDVLTKTKTPKLVRYETSRAADDRERFSRIANLALASIEAGIFIPNRGWLCSDCEYAGACRHWPLN